jgi:uncharacterized protein (DUF342 family)
MDKKSAVSLKQFGSAGFIVKSAMGIGVDLAKLESSAQLVLFADRVFSAGYYFSGLDYAVFQHLLMAYTPAMQMTAPSASTHKTGQVRFAAEIMLFLPERRALYKSPVLLDDQAEYLFEPVMVEKTVSQPLYDDAHGNGSTIIGYQEITREVRETLLFDEFVADMWTKGVRFGIDAPLVSEILSKQRTGRLVFARPLAPVDGIDATLQEQSDKLYRDDAPRRLSSGLVDLKQFKNRFPQIKANELLLKKIPGISGVPGMNIAAEVVEAQPPKDFDISKVCGPGTRVERREDGAFIVADRNGFLNIDTKTNRIAVTEKIINHGGVSMRTTGDLSLDGEFFEEHGEVQEKRVIQGRNITVFADVYGKIISRSGLVWLKQNLVSGSACSEGGNIQVEGLASNAFLQACGGSITLQRAENSVIVGKRVQIESAVNCCVVAESVQIQLASGCQIAGKDIHIETAATRKNSRTIVHILLPEEAAPAQATDELQLQLLEIEQKIGQLRQEVVAFSQNEEVMNYLVQMGKVQRKEVSLSALQLQILQKTGVQVAPVLRATAKIKAEIQSLRQTQQDLQQQAGQVVQARASTSHDEVCMIALPDADTLVQIRHLSLPELQARPPRELKALLQDEGGMHLPHNGSAFCWKAEQG